MLYKTKQLAILAWAIPWAVAGLMFMYFGLGLVSIGTVFNNKGIRHG